MYTNIIIIKPAIYKYIYKGVGTYIRLHIRHRFGTRSDDFNISNIF